MIAGGLTALTMMLLTAAPAPAAKPAVTHVPPPKVVCTATELILGDADASLSCNVTLAEGQAVEASANVGALVRAGPLTGGVQRFDYQPPSEKLPRVALLAFWRTDAAPEQAPEVELVRISLLGRQTLTVATRPGAQVEVALGRRRFGPVKASTSGSAQLDVEVPPEATGAVVFARSAGQVREDKLPIEVPVSNPLHVVMTPKTLTPGASAWLWVFHHDRLPGRQLEFAHRGLTFERLSFARDRGLFRVTVKPDAKEARLEARLEGAPEASIVMEKLLP